MITNFILGWKSNEISHLKKQSKTNIVDMANNLANGGLCTYYYHSFGGKFADMMIINPIFTLCYGPTTSANTPLCSSVTLSAVWCRLGRGQWLYAVKSGDNESKQSKTKEHLFYCTVSFT